MTNNSRRHLRYSKADGEKYRALIQDDLSPFYGATYKDVFIYAAAYGFRYGTRQALIKGSSKHSSFRLQQRRCVAAQSHRDYGKQITSYPQ